MRDAVSGICKMMSSVSKVRSVSRVSSVSSVSRWVAYICRFFTAESDRRERARVIRREKRERLGGIEMKGGREGGRGEEEIGGVTDGGTERV
jgi:hypothetical protein